MKDFKVRCTKSDTKDTILGKVYEVKNGVIALENGNTYSYGGGYNCVDDINKHLCSDFELVEENEMRKDDLKVGYVVELHSGRKMMVMPYDNKMCLVDQNGCWEYFSEYKSDLTHEGRDNILDIDRVYGLSDMASESIIISTKRRKLLWERKEEPLEITTAEAIKILAEKKGVPTDRIRIKE